MAALQNTGEDRMIFFCVAWSFARSNPIGHLRVCVCVCGEIWNTRLTSNSHTDTHRKNLRKSWSAQYWQFLGKKFKPYLIICSPGAKRISELKEDIPSTLANMLSLIHMILGNATSFILPCFWIRFSVELLCYVRTRKHWHQPGRRTEQWMTVKKICVRYQLCAYSLNTCNMPLTLYLPSCMGSKNFEIQTK